MHCLNWIHGRLWWVLCGSCLPLVDYSPSSHSHILEKFMQVVTMSNAGDKLAKVNT
ncbi:hypothetical protein AAZV13_19G020100 [Glycine max]